MGELTGGLIQMNAKMVVTGDAKYDMIAGLFGFIIFSIWTVWSLQENRKAWAVLFGVLVVISAAMFIRGVNTPRVKEIRACVDGPISLEKVSTIYDIVGVDGKELILRER